MKNTILIALALANCFIINGQQNNAGDAKRSQINIEYLGESYPDWDDEDYLPSIIDLSHMNKSDNEELHSQYKQEAVANSPKDEDISNAGLAANTGLQKTESANLSLLGSFDALTTQGTPSDNSIAVNTQGRVIVAVNSNLRYYNINGTAASGYVNLHNFFANPKNGSLASNNICDPVVKFDPEAKRFIVMAITCDFSSTAQSQILIAFSKTEDPLQGWNVYQFSGSPSNVFSQSMLFDYPKLGVSNHDVFITGNFFKLSNGGYQESGVYQIDKTIGYSGGNYTSGSGSAIVFTGISGNPFTLVPATNGQLGGYGNNMYLMASKPTGSMATHQIKLYEINTYVQNNPTITLTSLYTTQPYYPAIDISQKGSNIRLAAGDSRGMDAIYLDGTVHFVFHVKVDNYYTGIEYIRAKKTGTNWNVDDMLISVNQTSLAFPSIASLGWSNDDQAVGILMDYASPADYPGVGAIFVSHEMEPSQIIAVKQGSKPVTQYSQLSQDQSYYFTRWGDYSGISRYYGTTPPQVVGYGMYGSSNNFWANNVSVLETQQGPLSNKAITGKEKDILTYPNPVLDVWTTKLNLSKSGRLDVSIYSVDGRKVKDLYTADLRKGDHEFRFNKGALSPGSYLVQFTFDNELMSTKKIQVAE